MNNINSKRLITDFVSKYRKHIIYAFIVWFIATAFVTYKMLMNSEIFDVLVCLGYAKAKFRSLFFFIPDSWFSKINSIIIRENFKSVIFNYHEDFSRNSWKLYLYIFSVFIGSFSICFFAVYKYFQYHIKRFSQNILTTGHLLNINEFQTKYQMAFGKYLKFSGLNLSERVFWTPFYVWGNDEQIHKTVGQFLTDARTDKRKIIIFEEGNDLFKNLAEKEDVLLNPQGKTGVSWNFLEDLRVNRDTFIEALMKRVDTGSKYQEIKDLVKYIANLDINTKEFFQILCFAPFKQIKPILKSFTNVEDNQNTFISIRNQIADSLYFFKTMTSKTEEFSINEYFKSDKSVLWISCENNSQVKSIIPFIEKIIDSKTIKIIVRENLIEPTENTIVINHSLFNSYKLYGENMLILTGADKCRELIPLFGEITTKYPSFFGIRYEKETRQIIPDFAIDTNRFFKFGCIKDVLRF